MLYDYFAFEFCKKLKNLIEKNNNIKNNKNNNKNTWNSQKNTKNIYSLLTTNLCLITKERFVKKKKFHDYNLKEYYQNEINVKSENYHHIIHNYQRKKQQQKQNKLNYHHHHYYYYYHHNTTKMLIVGEDIDDDDNNNKNNIKLKMRKNYKINENLIINNNYNCTIDTSTINNKICIICRNMNNKHKNYCTFHNNNNNNNNNNIDNISNNNNYNNNLSNYKNNNHNNCYKRHDKKIKNNCIIKNLNMTNCLTLNNNNDNNKKMLETETETNCRKYPRRRKYIIQIKNNNNNNKNQIASMPNIIENNNNATNLIHNLERMNNNNNNNKSSSNYISYNSGLRCKKYVTNLTMNVNENVSNSNETSMSPLSISSSSTSTTLSSLSSLSSQHQYNIHHNNNYYNNHQYRHHHHQQQYHHQQHQQQQKQQQQKQKKHHSKWYSLPLSSSLLLLQVVSHRISFLIENISNNIINCSNSKINNMNNNNKMQSNNNNNKNNNQYQQQQKHNKKMIKLWRTFTRKFFIFILWSIILILLVNFSLSLLTAGAYANELNGPRLRNFSKVCTSMDIRNTPKTFENLSNCSVIEGFLVVSLIDKYSEHDYENLSFPLLTEITDYLLVYRVNGLRTLGNLFPNLSVIRGNTLFEGYALVIYENNNLQEIDLKSLTTIKRGAIRIEKNPLLCFVETINWSKIAVNTSTESHFFRENKVINECASCPSGEGQDDGLKCPLYPGGKRYCWNRKHCQKICPDRCKNTCNDKGECCHESCLGGCDNSDVRLCSVCRNLVFGLKCVKTCPDKFYQFLERSCISADDCFSKKPSLNPDVRHEHPYVIHEGICTTRCPNNYEKVNNQTCEPCKNGKCVRKCPGAQIDSISDARRLRGCTVITSPLLISIRQSGQHLMEDLENALSSIEEIEGYLKVSRSFALLSLSFLKQLRVIKGNELESGKYALYVLDNQNLQNIWGDNQTVIIERGRIFFHFNPKLCYYKIRNLLSMMVYNDPLETSEVATDSNGDRGSCNITTLNVTVTGVASRAAIISIEPMEFDDDRNFIGYQYFYIEAPYKNVSIYDSRHGCGNDGWTVDDDNTKSTHHIFTHLKPFTQYAFYVKTYTIASEHRNGQSNITYFRTAPDKPDMVRNLKFHTLSSSEVMIRWLPPKEANGNLTTYVIKANLTADDPKLLDQRNYCVDPIKQISYDISQVIPQSTSDKDIRPGTGEKDCMCDDGEGGQGKKQTNEPDEHVIENVIDFEDKIQNFIYIKHETSDGEPKSVRRKREDKLSSSLSFIASSLSSLSTDTSTDPGDKVFPQTDVLTVTNEIDPKEVTKSRKEGIYFTYIYETVNTSIHEFIFKDLKHYSSYTISVKACREGSLKDKIQDRCSVEAITVARTLRKVGADDVRHWKVDVESTNNSRSFIRLQWEPPPKPNSMVVSYSIKYKRADIEHAKYLDKCITQREYQNLTNGYILSGLDSGNYSLQLMATSLAGDGNFTEPKYVIIPEQRLSWQIITLIVLILMLFIIAIGVLIWYVRKKYLLQQPNNMKLITTVNPEYVSMQYTPDEWELPRDKIVQLRELGQGSFGMVYEGIVKNYGKNNEDIPCAIKTVNESATDRERANFLKEASVMKDFDTHHVVRLLGVVSRGQPTLVVMELMINGDLKGYLRQHRPDAENLEDGDPPPQPPTLRRILQMAIEIADGMAYLSAKKYVHRDLAARNCMVAADLTVKIGDFGMTRDIYETDYYRKGTKGLLPVRWMAPESLKDGVFTSSSDVFSYGVVLWEMATLASQPYQGLSNDQVLRYVIDGGVMERPENCPDKLYNLMQKCWQHRPSSRPSFMDIIQYLLDDADPKFRKVSFYHSDQGRELLAQMTAATDIDDVTTPLRVGDDDFKMDVDDNFLLNRGDSHLVQEEQPHSPYSLGFEVKICSTPGDASQRYNQNSPSIRISDIRNETAAAAAAASAAAETVQSSTSNSIVPPRLRGMELFLRNAFWGSNSGNNSTSTAMNSKDDKSTTLAAGGLGSGSSSSNTANNGIGGGLGHKNFLRAFVRFGSGSSKENGVEMKKNNASPRDKRNIGTGGGGIGGVPRNYQKLNESTASTKSATTPGSIITSQSDTNSTWVEDYPEITPSVAATAISKTEAEVTLPSATATATTTKLEIPEATTITKESVTEKDKKVNTYPSLRGSNNNSRNNIHEELSLPSLQPQNILTQLNQCNDRNFKVINSSNNSNNNRNNRGASGIASPHQSQRQEQQRNDIPESLPLSPLIEQHQRSLSSQESSPQQQQQQQLDQQQQQANGYVMQREAETLLSPLDRHSSRYQSVQEKLLPQDERHHQIVSQLSRGGRNQKP